MDAIVVITLLLIKHFIVDFPLQAPFQFLNKGKYGHPGGIIHAGLHTLGSLVVLTPLLGYNTTLFVLCFVEGIIHYHIDWIKMNFNRIQEWECSKHKQFWTLMGFDQLVHQLTYVGMVLVLFLR